MYSNKYSLGIVFFLLDDRNGFPAIPKPTPMDFKPPRKNFNILQIKKEIFDFTW